MDLSELSKDEVKLVQADRKKRADALLAAEWCKSKTHDPPEIKAEIDTLIQANAIKMQAAEKIKALDVEKCRRKIRNYMINTIHESYSWKNIRDAAVSTIYVKGDEFANIYSGIIDWTFENHDDVVDLLEFLKL